MRTILICALLVGCAETRYLTKEQDAEMKASCEPAGCKVVPNPIWMQIEQLLKQIGLRGA